MKKLLAGLVAVVTLSIVILIAQAQRHVVTSHSVVINAPVKEVWDFLSDNRHAKGWSVIFDHIRPLESSPVAEGQIGALRRCFRNDNEEGFFWDERTLTAEPYKRRTLRTYMSPTPAGNYSSVFSLPPISCMKIWAMAPPA